MTTVSGEPPALMISRYAPLGPRSDWAIVSEEDTAAPVLTVPSSVGVMADKAATVVLLLDLALVGDREYDAHLGAQLCLDRGVPVIRDERIHHQTAELRV